MMLDFKSLKTKYGNTLAKQIRDDKKKLEETKKKDDETIYFMKHPDLGDTTEARPSNSFCKKTFFTTL